jgi:hypothetical protein
MARNRIIYQSEALFVGQTGDTSPQQLHRVQSANYSFELARTDINQFGQLAAIDRIILEQPTVSLDFDYYPTTGDNEDEIGFDVGGTSALSKLLSGSSPGAANRRDVHNYYITTVGEGDDSVGSANTEISGVVGIGNGFLSSYSVEGSVGDFVSASVSVEALNLTYESTSANSVANPAVTPEDGTAVGGNVTMQAAAHGTGAGIPMALRPGDVNVSIPQSGALGLDTGDLKVQNFSVSFDMSREDIQKLGSRFAYAKEIEFPAAATADVSSIIGDFGSADKGVEDIINEGDQEFDFVVECEGANIGAPGTTVGMKFTLKGAKLNSHSVSSSVGDNKSLDLSFETQIGGPQDTDHGIKMETNAT